jgi:hypothetical protein
MIIRIEPSVAACRTAVASRGDTTVGANPSDEWKQTGAERDVVVRGEHGAPVTGHLDVLKMFSAI